MTIAIDHPLEAALGHSLSGEHSRPSPVWLAIAVSWTGSWGSCPLLCFPPMGLSTRRLPSLLRGPGEPGSPALISTMKALRLPIRVSTVTYGFAPAAHAILHHSCSPWRSREIGGFSQARVFCSDRPPLLRFARAWTRMGSLRSSGNPSCAFAPFQDPGRTDVSSP